MPATASAGRISFGLAGRRAIVTGHKGGIGGAVARVLQADGVEVIGRMGKRGRNSVSVVIDGKRYKVKRLSSRHSERVAAKYASKGKGYAKRAKRTGSAPKGRTPGMNRPLVVSLPS